jgi:hypothetical protein
MSIRVRCKDSETLEITNIVHEHNHEVSKAAFNYLFHQRRLDSGQKNEIESVLKFKKDLTKITHLELFSFPSVKLAD